MERRNALYRGHSYAPCQGRSGCPVYILDRTLCRDCERCECGGTRGTYHDASLTHREWAWKQLPAAHMEDTSYRARKGLYTMRPAR